MRRDTDRRASNTVQVAILWMSLHLETFSSFEVPLADANYSQNCSSHIMLYFMLADGFFILSKVEFPMIRTLEFPLPDSAESLEKSFSFSLHYLLGSPL